MKTLSALAAKNAFGLMIDTARAEPMLIEQHGRAVVMVISGEEYDRLHGDAPTVASQLLQPGREQATTRGRVERT